MLSELLQTTTLDDAPAYWFLNNLHIVLANSESTGGAYSLVHLTGGFFFLPRGVPHGFRSSSEKDGRLLTHVLPGAEVGFMGMMLEMALPATERVLQEPTPPDFQRLRAVCAKNKIDIIGPLPE
jgi:hypothetical protein